MKRLMRNVLILAKRHRCETIAQRSRRGGRQPSFVAPDTGLNQAESDRVNGGFHCLRSPSQVEIDDVRHACRD